MNKRDHVNNESSRGVSRLVAAVALLCASFDAAAAITTYTWQPVDGSYDGLFTDPAHWGLSSSYPGETTGNQMAKFPAAEGQTSRIYFPDGTFDNYSSFRTYIATGQSTWFIGTNTTWNLPAITDGTARDTCIVYLNATTSSTAKNGSAFRDGKTDSSARLSLTNFKIEHSSTAARGTCLDIWEGDVTSPVDNWFYSDNATQSDRTGRFELCFHPGTTSTLGGLYIGSMTATNAFTFLGGTHTLGSWRQQWNVGNPATGTRNQVDFTFKGGANVSFGGFMLGFSGNTPTSAAMTYHVHASEGARVTTSASSSYSCGTFDFDVSGENTCFGFNSASSFGTGADTDFKFRVADGAKLLLAAQANFGTSTAAALESNSMELLVTNATLEVNASNGRMTMNSGSLSIVDSDVTVAWNAGISGSSSSTCYMNGVNLVTTTTAAFLNGFDTVALGGRGLSVYSKHPVTAYNIAQSFSNSAGEVGELCLGTQYTSVPYTLSAADSTEARLVVSNGTVKLASGANHYSHLIVRSGATFTMKDGATSARLRGLTLGSDMASAGTFELNPTDTVRVEGPISFVNGVIRFSSTLSEGANVVLVSTAATQAERDNWALGCGFEVEGLPSGAFVSFATEETLGGETEFQIVVRSALPETQGTREWADGTGLDATWVATFTGVTPKSVAVGGTKEVGGLSFSEGGYVLSGGTIALMRSTAESAGISVSNGTVEIASDLHLVDFGKDLVEVYVAAGATLTISGRVIGAGIRKTGGGKLVLSNTGNQMPCGVTTAGGLVSATDPLATGGAVVSSVHAALQSGTLEVSGNASRQVPGVPVDIEGTSATEPVVVKADVDATLRLGGGGTTGASLFKRGVGALAFQVDGDLTLNVKSDHATSISTSTALAFDTSGAGPDVPRAGLNVAEGELAFRAVSGNPKLTISGAAANGDARQCLYLAYPYANAAAEPKFTLDGVRVVAEGQATSFANCMTANNSAATRPELLVTNGAYLSVWTFAASGSSTKPGLSPKAAFDNGTLYTQGFTANAGGTSVVTNEYVFRNGSKLCVTAQNEFNGPLVMTFDNSLYANNSSGACANTLALTKDYSSTAIGRILSISFANKSLFAVSAINRNSGTSSARAELSFDDSEWFCGDSNRTIPSTTMNVVTTARVGGFVLAPPSGRTWTWVGPLVGTGGIVKKGDGTLVMGRRIYLGSEHEDPATLLCTGTNVVESGVLVLADGALGAAGASFRTAAGGVVDFSGADVSAPVRLGGSGTYRNGTLEKGEVVYDPSALPLLDFENGLAAAGRIVVGLGLVPSGREGKEVAVARYTGTLPAGLSFSVKATGEDGRSIGGSVRAADGVLYATPTLGLLILVR